MKNNDTNKLGKLYEAIVPMAPKPNKGKGQKFRLTLTRVFELEAFNKDDVETFAIDALLDWHYQGDKVGIKAGFVEPTEVARKIDVKELNRTVKAT